MLTQVTPGRSVTLSTRTTGTWHFSMNFSAMKSGVGPTSIAPAMPRVRKARRDSEKRFSSASHGSVRQTGRMPLPGGRCIRDLVADFGEERGDDAAFDPARHDEGDRQVGHGTEQFFGLLDVADPEAAARNGSEHFGVDQFAQRQMDGLAAAPGRLFEGPDRGQVLPLRRPPVDDMAQDLLPHLMDFVSQNRYFSVSSIYRFRHINASRPVIQTLRADIAPVFWILRCREQCESNFRVLRRRCR